VLVMAVGSQQFVPRRVPDQGVAGLALLNVEVREVVEAAQR
jgi:hypothetical protein